MCCSPFISDWARIGATGSDKVLSFVSSRAGRPCHLELFVHARTYVLLGDNYVVEPDGLFLLVVLAGGVGVVVAVVFEPEAVDLEVGVVAPADAGEVACEFSVE